MASEGTRKKLLLYEKVEVRSEEDGFVGSWHSGTVISCEYLARVVQYDHLLNDEGSSYLTERVIVSPAVEGCMVGDIVISDKPRGRIRPLLPSSSLSPQCLSYGQCVDLFHADAWWEGVVFDMEFGSEQRSIFFPDMGDEMEVWIDKLRLSKDWDEISEEWKPRKNWHFLEVIEEFEKNWPLPVSVKQIWYEVRMKSGFKKLREWTYHGWDLWRELVCQVLLDNFRIVFEQLATQLNPSSDTGESRQHILEFSETVFNAFLNEQPQMDHGISTTKACLMWQPAAPAFVPGPDFCPGAIYEVKELFGLKKKPSQTLLSNARAHLLYLGWKVEVKKDKGFRGMLRFRYVSPDGELFYSLCQVCRTSDLVCQEMEPAPLMLMDSSNSNRSPIRSTDILESEPQSTRELFSPDIVIIEPEYCPDAVRDYYNPDPDNRRVYSFRNPEVKLRALRAKKHLSAIGWSFKCISKRDRRQQLQYISPRGIIYHSLVSACKWCVDTGELTSSNSPPTVGGPGNVKAIKKANGRITIDTSHSQLFSLESSGNFSSVNAKFKNLSSVLSTPEGLSQSNEGEIYKIRIPREPEKHGEASHIHGSSSANKRRKLRQPLKVQGDMSPDHSIPGRDASKRARSTVASSSQKAPKTVLSWLIDNNVILRRTKVQYRGRKGVNLKEGSISREGIKCSCCGEIFGLSKFEAHAGSTNRRPSANIFLEDGRSLLECQMQLRASGITKRLSSGSCRVKQSPGDKNNDDMCTKCHYGGELVLCDQCPSSFHAHCLGLKEVADGDWFCPSCCCKICGNGKFYTRNGEVAASSILVCYQCERSYHADCLREKGNVNLDDYHQGEWFCQETCKQIYSGLHKLLGKPIPVTRNLTWTLAKYTKPDSCDRDDLSDDCKMESYSKLNVALSVMHECFEPVKDPTTGRDLVEDVIFNRRSELRRLNFPGFYTVILEENEELISAATVRIYGERVAEVPLVATRFGYRRRGMCRILMNELEKRLKELAVERLVLPAIPSILCTWTNSFGFSVMNESEKLNFLDYTFLNFEGTVFCEKVLVCNDPITPSPSTGGTLSKSSDQGIKNLSVVLAGISTVSQVDQVAERTTSHAACTDNEKENSSGGEEMMDQSTPLKQWLPFPTVTNEKQVGDSNGAGLLKCYKRRRICAC